MSPNLLALDIGTSNVHCMVTDDKCVPLVDKNCYMRYFTPSDGPELAREFDPSEVMSTVERLVARVIKAAGISRKDIQAIGVTGQRQGVVFVDGHGKELLTSPNVDLRAVFEGALLDEAYGPAIYRTCGHSPSLLLAPARLRWLAQNQSDTHKELRSLLTVPAWLTYRLTGVMACEPSLAAATGLLEISTRKRCYDLLEKLDLSSSLLPPLYNAGEVIGGLNSELANRWGLMPGTPVTLAGADTQCGLLGMGLASYGDVGIVAGWSCALQTVTKAPIYDDTMNSWVGCYPTQESWVFESNLGDIGNAHNWLKNALLGENAPWEMVNKAATIVPPGSNGILCYLGSGPRSAISSGLGRGGLLFPIPLRYQEPQAEQFIHASWENLAYSVKANLTTVQRITGSHNDTINLGGGMAQSNGLAQVVADILGRKIRLSKVSHVSVLGAARVAAVAAGTYTSIDEAAKSSSSEAVTLEPNLTNTLEYQGHFQEWKRLYYKLQYDNADFE